MRPGADPNNPQPGDYTQSTTLSPIEQQLFDQEGKNRYGAGLAAGGVLDQLNSGPRGIQDALYNNQTRYYDQRFGNDQSALETKLQNQGVTPGSQAWSQAMQSFDQNKNQAYDTATNNAIVGATGQQSALTSQLAQLLAGSQAQVPTAPGGGSGADLLGALKDSYGGQLGNVNAGNAATAGSSQQLEQLAMMAAMMYFGGGM